MVQFTKHFLFYQIYFTNIYLCINFVICIFTKTKKMTIIKKYILSKHESVTDFAIKNGWSQQRASYIANKDPKELTPLTIKKIAKALNEDVDKLRLEILND